MFDRARLWLSALAILAVAFVVWLPTIGWGLPSRDADKYLFGDRRPWTGAEIVALVATTQPTDSMRGADVDADPIIDRSKPVILNDTDAKRAAIVRRYRLMSGQPDEFIQFKALSEMAARSGLSKLDPRLYQYGGLWMYPVGALVRSAMLVGYIPSPPPGTPAIEFYLDHPEAFGKFYVVARFYSWCWGVVAAFAIAWIARRVTESIGLATLAAVAFMLLPVTRTATHEAKPHLAGAALCLCAVIAATRYVETGKRRWLIGTGVLCGAAMAMVVSMLLSCAVLPTMVWLRRRETLFAQRASRLVAVSTDPNAGPRQVAGLSASAITLMTSLAIAALVYVATNPFVLINAIAHPAILRSNLENSTAMYSPRSDGIYAVKSAYRISVAAVTPICFWIGLALLIGFAIAFLRRKHRSMIAIVILLAFPCALSFGQFILLASGKPAEYARFGLLIVAVASIGVTAALQSLARAFHQSEVLSLIALIVSFSGLFVSEPDWIEGSSRLVTQAAIAREASQVREHTGKAFHVATLYEPAPWSAPAMNLFDWEIYLVSPHRPADAFELTVWPTNLSTQVDRGNDEWESVDWLYNNYGNDWQLLNSDSRPAGSRPAG